MQTTIVYKEDGTYAGWPANHGAWQWGDEFLVGFMTGEYVNGWNIHDVKPPFTKMQARSLDGGETWVTETPNVDFDCESTTACPAFSLSDTIVRCCGIYDHGGETCDQHGGLYLSKDKGKTWSGPYAFSGTETDGLLESSTRTCVVDDEHLIVTKKTKGKWGSDYPIYVRHDGYSFKPVSVVNRDKYRSAMPSSAKLDSKIFVAIRRRSFRSEDDCWIDLFSSDDNGESWGPNGLIARTGEANGNPPALRAAGGRLHCAYANRTDRRVYVSRSEDYGKTWDVQAITEKGGPDIGYPQLFEKENGSLVCVFYWQDEQDTCPYIRAVNIGRGSACKQR